MKKIFIGICMFGMLTLNISPLLAGGIDNKHNWSAEYIRTLNRNAATDSADIVAYNPAGIMKMANGAYVNFSVQGVFKTYENTVDGIEFESDVSSYIPGVFSIYKQDKWAAFAGFTIPAGGGKVEYDNGNASSVIAANKVINFTPASSVTSQSVNAKSYYYGITLGGAYAINDKVSLSLSGRYIEAFEEAKALVTFDIPLDSYAEYEKTAYGLGGIIGINLSPTDELNIGMRYETRTHLRFKYEVKADTGAGLLANQPVPITNGKKARRDLPPLFGLGVSYMVTPKIRVETDLTYYFNEEADWEGKEETADNGYDLGIAFEYIFNEKIKASLGYMYTEVGIKPEDILPESPQLNASTVGAGFAFKASPALDFNFAVGKVFYKDDSYINISSGVPLAIEYDKDIIFLAFGIQYKFI